jgi:MFS family permease
MSTLSSEQTTVIQHTPAVPSALLKRWLLAFDCFNATAYMGFTQVIWVVYLFTRGYSSFEIGLFETLFHVAKFAAEVPTGAFADLVGRRASLIAFCVLNAVGDLLFLAPTPAFITLSFAISGVAYAFRGGASEALLWRFAEQSGASAPSAGTGPSERYSQLVTRMYLVGLIGEISGPAAGGFLGNLIIILPFVVGAAVQLSSIVPLLFLPEQRALLNERPHPLQHIAAGWRAARRDRVLIGLLAISALMESVATTTGYYNQLYLHGLGLALTGIGLASAASMGTNVVLTAVTPRLMRHFTSRRLIPACIACQIVGLLLMSAPQPALSLIGFVVVFQVGSAVLYPALSTYINERSPEAQRATVISFQSGLFSAAMIILFPLFGLSVMSIPYGAMYIGTALALGIACFGIWKLTAAGK